MNKPPYRNRLTWEEKLLAIKALDLDVSLRMKTPGEWYVSMPGISIKKPSVSESATDPTARSTPEEAVEHAFTRITDLLNDDYYLVTYGNDDHRKVRWNGFMWADISIST